MDLPEIKSTSNFFGRFNKKHSNIQSSITNHYSSGSNRPSTGLGDMEARLRRTEYHEMSESFHQESEFSPPADEFDFEQKLETGRTTLEHCEEENSPVEVVRATVSTIDNQTLPTLTFRFWVLSTLFIVLGSVLNGFYYFKNLSGFFYGIAFVQLASYPLGKAMARWLPTQQYSLFSFSFTLNPGPFSLKEHALIGIAGGIAGDYPSALDALMTMQVYYGINHGSGFAIVFVLASQLLGYGMVGFFWRYLVEPAIMIWPDTLVATAFYNTLHERKNNFTKNLSRTSFFMLVFGITFAYQVLPLYLMPILSSMAVLCWIAPQNSLLQMLGSGYSGLGILDISLDWNAVSATFDPLYTPFWSQASILHLPFTEINYLVGLCTLLWFISTAFYFTNTWSAQSYYILSSSLYNSTHGSFDPKSIMSLGGQVNETVLNNAMPIYISPFFATVYGVSFMGITATITHFFLYFFPDVLAQWRGTYKPDIHTKLMRKYEETPFLWFAILFAFAFALGIVLCIVWDSLPWYGLILCVVLGLFMALPIGMLQGISGFQLGLNVLMEQICGYIFPGLPIANMVFKTFGYNSMYQCLSYIKYGKLSHYLKIPPRHLFVAQIYACVISSLLTWVTTQVILTYNSDDILASLNNPGTSPWTLQGVTLYYTATVIWGVIGPARFFSPSTPYNSLLWCYLIGVLLPTVIFLLHRWQPRLRFLQFVNIPIITIGAAAVPENYTNFITVAFVIGFVFQFWLYRMRHDWWKKYNYVLAAAMHAGTQICGMAIFFFLTSTNANLPVWWGNNPNNPEQCGS